MTRARSLVAMLAGTVAAAAVLVVPSGAQEADFGWSSGWTDPAEEPATFAVPRGLAGWFRYGPPDEPGPALIDRIDARLAVAAGTELPAGCPTAPIVVSHGVEEFSTTTPSTEPPSQPTTPTTRDDSRVDFVFGATEITPLCNGTYTATVAAHTYSSEDSDVPLTKTVLVAIGPPPVTSLSASSGTDRIVTLKWQVPPAYGSPSTTTTSTTPTVPASSSPQESGATAARGVGPPPDFLGYVVERSDAGGEFQALTTTTPDVLSFTDSELPAEGGTVKYRVRGVRSGATAGTTALAAANVSPTRDVNIDALPVPPTTARPRPGSSGGGTRSTAPPTTVEVLPESELEPGEDEAVVPADADQFGGPIVNEVSEAGPGRAVLVPVAIGLVMLVWAMHLRFLARVAARPA